MKTLLPDRQTIQPSRKGLVFHEILADGFIHAATVFGIEPDNHFVERVATIAWSNGAYLVQKDVSRAAQAAKKLCESLEMGRSEALKRCNECTEAVAGTENTFGAIRIHYNKHFGTQKLVLEIPEEVRTIRQLISEAALCGLLCRGLAPSLYQAITAQNERCSLETAYLRLMFRLWSTGTGLPPCHPFLEMAELFYLERPAERDLTCGAIARLLPNLMEQENPWALEHWLMPGWNEGVMQARMAPDLVAAAMAEFHEGEHDNNLRIFSDYVVVTAAVDGPADLTAAFEQFVAAWNPYQLAEPEIRNLNPRVLAARAFDFALWMGIIAGLPAKQGRKRGVA